MFERETLQRIADAEGVPLEVVERIAGDVERKESVAHPVALLTSWVRNEARRRNAAPKAATAMASKAAARYFGFTSNGSLVRSAEPVLNAVSEYAAWLVREMHDQQLVPAEVAAMVRARGGAVLEAFGEPLLADWEGRATLHTWAFARATSALHDHVRSWGGRHPWTNAPARWAGIVAARAERDSGWAA